MNVKNSVILKQSNMVANNFLKRRGSLVEDKGGGGGGGDGTRYWLRPDGRAVD